MRRYILLYLCASALCILTCNLDLLIEDINYTFQEFLIAFFRCFSCIVIVIGAIKTMPKNKTSSKRIWFYYACIGGCITTLTAFRELINTLIR